MQISSQKKRTGVISPKRFIQKLKRDKEQFRSYDEHQVRICRAPNSAHNCVRPGSKLVLQTVWCHVAQCLQGSGQHRHVLGAKASCPPRLRHRAMLRRPSAL